MSEHLLNANQCNEGDVSEIFPDISVSIIIATRDRHEEIQRALHALLNGTRRPDEIVIYDQSDNELTRKEVDEIRLLPEGSIIKYFSSKKKGISANRNDALRAASGDFIASVDDDIEVDNQWLELMLHEWVDKWGAQPVLITGPIMPAPEFEPGALITAVRTSKDRIVYTGKARYTNVLIGAQFGASRELIAHLSSPPFDERLGAGCQFPGADDEEFSYRVRKAGFPVVYEPSIIVTHYTERVSDWRRVNFKYGIGNGAAMAKHFLQGDMYIMKDFFTAVLTNVFKSLKYALRLKEPEGSARLFSAVGLVYGFVKWVTLSIVGRLKPEDGSNII